MKGDYQQECNRTVCQNTPAEPEESQKELKVKTGQIIEVDGTKFVFGKDKSTGEIKPFYI